ncbi:amidohydrolase family protein [Falsiroseomonas sp. HW251]|uniref:amidohydrolase family protein n=1 Tax=Falsiroseomonas sp. HW251 TaxID=3390998 RepID=UPI003D323DF1
MERSIALDCHTHLAPIVPDLLRAIPDVDWREAELKLMAGSVQLAGGPKVTRPEALLAWMDENGIRRAWYSVPPPMYRDGIADEAAARAWCGYVNQALRVIGAPHAARLSPSFLLPVRHPALAAEIAAACAQHGAHFAMAAGHAASAVMLSDPTYDALWSALDSAQAFVLLHPTTGSDPRLDRFFLHNLIGGPGETALAAAHLAMGRVIERFPRIRFILSHGGGSAALAAGRIARGQAVGRPGADTGAPPMTQAFRHFMVDCIAHSAAGLSLVADVFGRDRLLFGSDWPFSMGLTDPWSQLDGVDPEVMAAIAKADPEA